MEIDERGIKGLACRALDLWLNLEAGRCKPDSQYNQVVEFLKQRFKAKEINPLLLTLGLLEMALIEDALKNKQYMSEEERERIIQDVVESLAENFPKIVDEMVKELSTLEKRITEFKMIAEKYRAGGE
ncbi:hypothetical protein SAMN06269117_11142 [Balnearium lithotrophicum]|uniref:Uncharacterized protein n=1 Tax=Balnearium lithotrophicum TaxID=223788 RepID=A0A521CBR8_9BACT|nr:hypothetical protein [Balnearium lithotrophicum]SMO56866.1 hypothetical protein SAMN06269117_11142 [Balnearium lithotrophicum]